MKQNKLVFGWGINDVDYLLSVNVELPKVDGKRKRKRLWICPYYSDWKSMLGRCFNPDYHKKQPTYIGCTICEEWKYLSNFIKWVDSQPNKDWRNCSLDKDLLVAGNKHYSPETCVYIPKSLNNFITDNGKYRGELMIGVSPNTRGDRSPYKAQCNNPFTGDRGYLGHFTTELEAHLAWKAKKHELACMYADLQSDERVAKRLSEMYTPETDWTNK